MQFATVVLAFFATAGMAAPGSPITETGIEARQDPRLKQAQNRLTGARNAAMEQIENGGGRGRRLGQMVCGRLCSQCQTGAVTTAVGEIALCGTAALGLAAVTGPLGIFLDVVGFAGCETAAIGSLNKSEAECKSLVG